MMNTLRGFSGMACHMLVVVLMIGMMTLVGCGGEAPPPAPPAPPASPAAPAPEPAAAPPAAPTPPAPAVDRPAPAFTPVVGDVLQYLPDHAQLAIGLPPINGILNKALPFAKRIAPPELDIEKEYENIIRDLARDADAPDAKTLGEIAAAKGVDADAPIAVFADFNKSFQKAGAKTEVDLADLEPPAIAGVLCLKDAAKAEATVKELISLSPDLSGVTAETVSVGDIAIQVYDAYGYFIADNKIALGSLDLVKQVAERFASPAILRYGTAACPATAPDEAAILMRGKQFISLLKRVLPALDMFGDQPFAEPLLLGQINSLDAMLADVDDPLVTTISWTKDRFEINSRLDTAAHPEVITFSGQAAPLRYVQKLPKDTVAMWAFRLTPEYKKQITDVYLKSLPAEMTQNPQFAQGLSIGNQLLTMLGEELTLGVSGAKDDFPVLTLMIGLANPEPTKGLLQMLVPMQVSEKHNEVDINQIQAPIPIPISLAFAGDMVLLSNDTEKMKGIIDLATEERTSGLLAGMEPPLSADTPRYSAFVLNTSLFSDVLLPLNAILNFLPAEAQPIMEQVSSVLRELRFFSEMDGSWISTKLSLYLREAV